MKEILKIILAIGVTALVAGFVFTFNVVAFNGPTQTPPSGSGALTVSTSSNISIGTSTPATSTRLFIIGSTTNSSFYGLRILDSSQNPVFSVRNDGVITVSTSTVISGGSFSGLISAANVSADQFGRLAGGGNFSFPGALTATSGTLALASTTVTGVVTTTNLSVTSVTNALLLASSTGAVNQYGGSTCSGGQAATALSATGTATCAVFGTGSSNVSTSTVNNWTSQQDFSAANVSTTLTVVGSSTLTGHLGFVTSSVSVSTCGASASVLGSDNVGIITVVPSTAACTLTFATAWKTAPSCNFMVSSGTQKQMQTVVTGSSVVITPTTSWVANSNISYQCFGNPN